MIAVNPNGNKVVNSGPISRWTTFTNTNWLPQIRLHASKKPQSRKRETVATCTLPMK